MLITKALLRGGIPLIIMGGIALLLYFQGKYADAKGTFIASLIAFFVGAATVMYNIDHWSFAKQSIVHFLIMLVTIYPIRSEERRVGKECRYRWSRALIKEAQDKG